MKAQVISTSSMPFSSITAIHMLLFCFPRINASCPSLQAPHIYHHHLSNTLITPNYAFSQLLERQEISDQPYSQQLWSHVETSDQTFESLSKQLNATTVVIYGKRNLKVQTFPWSKQLAETKLMLTRGVANWADRRKIFSVSVLKSKHSLQHLVNHKQLSEGI